MKRVTLFLLSTILILNLSTSFAQATRESTHIVQPGETLGVIATRYDVDLKNLAAANNIYNLSAIQSWQELAIPIAPAAATVHGSFHIVQYGEMLSAIAQRYGVDVFALMRYNDLSSHVIHPGQVLRLPSTEAEMAVVAVAEPEEVEAVPEPKIVEVDPGPEDAAPDPIPASGKHIVRRGETLVNIAAAYGIDLSELITENGIFNHIIYPGQALILPGIASPDTAESPENDTAPDPSREHSSRAHIGYVIRSGDTLSEIAEHFGMTLANLMRANEIYYPHLIYVGQQLRIPAATSVNLSVDAVESWPEPAAESSPVSAPATESATTVVENIPSASDTNTAASETDDRATVFAEIHKHATETAETDGRATEAAEIDEQAKDAAEHEPEAAETAPDVFTPPADHFPHEVQLRETLSAIAKHYGVSMVDLMSANGIIDADRIDQGQTIWIPPTAITREPPAPPAAPVAPVAPVAVAANEAPSSAVTPGERDIYVVQPGEILSIIGNKLGMNWIVIAEVNGLANPNRLHAGMELLVPNVDDLAKYPPSYGSNRYNLYSDDPGPHVGVGREFVVVLSTQRAYAYEDGVLKKAALVSTGLPATPTVQGNYRIYLKRRSQRMSGPGYDLDNVEWVMFFHRGYAFHGTWWHNNFGQPMSHGCVNMTNPDARWFYEFGSIGTPVHVRYY